MDEQSCDMDRRCWLVYRNPNKHPERLRFVGAFDTAAGAEAGRAKTQVANPHVTYSVVDRPADGEIGSVKL